MFEIRKKSWFHEWEEKFVIVENIIPHRAVEYRWNIELKSMNQILRHFVNIQIFRHFVNIPRICLTLRLGLYTRIAPADVQLSNYKQHFLFEIFLTSLFLIFLYKYFTTLFRFFKFLDQFLESVYCKRRAFSLKCTFLWIFNHSQFPKGDLSFYTFLFLWNVVYSLSLKLD